MVQTCHKCSRANPAGAVYCFFDGFALGEANRRGGPVAVGAQPFNSPFVLPTGRTCRNFDELALAFQMEWSSACALLRDGYLESFFGGIGRLDLVQTAGEAARFPEPDRGLDQLLAKLPSTVLADPQLRVDPAEVNLGVVESGRERSFELDLENQGMRLLYGTVSVSDVWLTLGEAPGANEKHFHFTHESQVKVHVWPDRVRASSKPIEASLLIESNAGPVRVKVRCEKPAQPFPAGPLGGCKTPRQVAEKAQSHPREVAPLFEAGEVERWYAANGWQYPVTVPVASGVAAVQQFFEALGVTRAPRVEINPREVYLEGAAGATLLLTIEVSSQEKRPVFAHVTCNAPWLKVGQPRLNGRTATIPLSVPSVPDEPGEALTAELDVLSNGKQRFRVPVRLSVAGRAAFDFSAAAPPLLSPGPAAGEGPPPPPPVASPPPVTEAPAPRRNGRVALSRVVPRDRSPSVPKSRTRGLPPWAHVVPAALLVGCVLVVVGFERFYQARGDVEGEKRPPIAGPAYDPTRLVDDRPRVGVSFNQASRFGIVMLDASDPEDRGHWKRLTAKEDGSTNNTIVRIGTSEYTFGFKTPSNRMMSRQKELPAPYRGWTSTMEFAAEQVSVTQYVQIVPGADNLLDTVLIYYRADNQGTLPRKIAIRLMLDTYIGKNDGVPFTVPGKSGFVTTTATFTGAEIPDYLEVVENPDDSRNPGTIARLGLKGLAWGDVDLVEPEKILISRFPGSNVKWDWEPEPMGDDSSVAVYWPEVLVPAKAALHVAATYGLGKLDVTDQLALSAPHSAQPGREFVVTAYVYNALAGQKVAIDLPAGLRLDPSTPAEQVLTREERRTQVFWKVRAAADGKFQIGATSEKSRAKPITIAVQARSFLG